MHVNLNFDRFRINHGVREHVNIAHRQGELKEDIMKNSPEEYSAWVADPSNFNFSGR